MRFLTGEGMESLLVVCLLILAVALAAKKDAGPVTCGSVIKLQHKQTVRFLALKNLDSCFIFGVIFQGNNLHSHSIAWGSGSGQQSITTNKAKSEKGELIQKYP